MELQRIVQTVNRLAWFFWHPLGFRDRNEILSTVGDWRAAFQWFLSSFAFERQGRSPYYSDFAVEAVKLYDGEIPGQDFEKKLWDSFLKRGGFPASGEGANKKNNPLAPSDNRHISAGRLVSSLEDFSFNMVQWALQLAQSGDVKRAWNKLVAIRGIGDKIASLYLRDIVDAFEIDEDIVGDKAYLQPIDAWTRRGAKALAEFISVAPRSDRDLAEVLVEVSEQASVRSTYTNTGLWFLGAQLVRDQERFHDLLLSADDLHAFLRDELYRHRKRAEILEAILSASGCDTQKAATR